jgi:hypothetical protein
MRILIAIALLGVCFGNASSQQVSTRAQEIAASFSKHKSVVKEKYGVSREKYKDVQSQPVAKQNTRDYSGVYEVSDLGDVIEIRVGRDGIVQANGYEKGQQFRSFKLENAKIEGALLTASKVYNDGTTEKFEGVFMTRTVRNSPTDNGVAFFGLGVLLPAPVEVNGLTYDKLFYQLSRTQ